MSTTPKKKNDNNDGNSNSIDDDDDKGMFSSWTTWFDELSDRQRLDRLRSCSELDQVLKSCQEKAKRQQEQIQKRQQQQEQQEEGKTRSSRWSLWNRSSSQQQQDNSAVSNSQAVDSGGDDDDDKQVVDLIERTSQGIRSMKYFGWRGVLSSSSKGSSNSNSTNETAGVRNAISNDNDNDTDRINNNAMIRQSCSREQHAVWACRAVATSCGHDLSLLKTCFENGDGGSSDDHQQPGTPRPKDILTTPHTAYHLGGGQLTSKKNNTMNIPCYDQQVQLGQCVTTQAQALLERKRRRESAGKRTEIEDHKR